MEERQETGRKEREEGNERRRGYNREKGGQALTHPPVLRSSPAV